MNTTLFVRRNFRRFALCAALFLGGAGLVPVHGQTTNDVSHFPSLDQLPGKVPPHVWSGLPGVWAANHAKWKISASNDVGAVVFLGDSITQGWSTLAKDFPNMKVANRGIGGDVTSGVLYRLAADVLSLDPKAIVLLIGTNDAGDGENGDDIASNIRLILLAIKNYNPNLKVIVCKIMPRADHNAEINNARIKKANALMADFVKTEPNFVLCDTWSAYTDETGNQVAADFRPDHLHLNAAGYVVWKRELDPILSNLHLEP
jgi:lysophospholipase L1-like esterase